MPEALDDINNIVIKNNNNVPILIKDVADAVHFGSVTRYGAFTEDGVESVGGQVLMLKGENQNEVIKKCKSKYCRNSEIITGRIRDQTIFRSK